MVADATNPYDIFSPESQRNPALYDVMRTNDPVHVATNPQTGHRHWFLTRHDDCIAFLRDKRFGKEFRRQLPITMTADWATNHSETTINRNMLSLDDPSHARLKAIIQVTFTPKKLASLNVSVQDIATQLMDVIDSDVADGDSFDLTQRYIVPLPLRTIATMLGLPAQDFEQLVIWTRAMLEPDEGIVQTAIDAFIVYLDTEITRRQSSKHRLPDMLSLLIVAQVDDNQLSREELHAMVFLLITAGFETMVNFVSNSVMTLLEFPAELAVLRQNLDHPEKVQIAIEELLRYSGPSHMTLPSWAFSDVVVRDKTILQGDIVHAVLFAANRDPLVFDDPHRFDVTRKVNPHIAFSYGLHHCLGAMLARSQSTIAITTLLRRLPNL